MNNDPSKPLINISVPEPLLSLDIFPLIIVYVTGVFFDYCLYCRTSIPYQKYKNWHRLLHLSIPFLIAPKNKSLYTPFIAFPWFVASVGAYASQKYKHRQLKEGDKSASTPQSLSSWLKSIGVDGFAQRSDRQPNSTTTLTNKQVRIEGVKRMIQVFFVMALGNHFITPLLLQDPATLFTMPWYSIQGIYYGFLMGLKGYTLMVSNDILSSICQIATGYRVLEVFNKPLLSTSPKEFWGYRWNLMVRHLFRKQLYVGIKPKDNKFSMSLKRLRAFFISALMHEAIMTIVNRKITMEQFSFFMVQGFAVYLQSVIPIPQCVTSKTPKIVSIALTMFFLSLTSKLFLNPFLRYDGQAALFSQNAFI